MPLDMGENVLCLRKRHNTDRSISEILNILQCFFPVQFLFTIREFIKSCKKPLRRALMKRNLFSVSKNKYRLLLNSSRSFLRLDREFPDTFLQSCLTEIMPWTFQAMRRTVRHANDSSQLHERLRERRSGFARVNCF